MTSLTGSSCHILHARFALEDEINRTIYYLRRIHCASNEHEKLYFMKAFYEYLGTHTIRLSHHVGFRLFILDQMAHIKKMACDHRYASHPHMKPILDSISNVETIIRETPIKGVF
jgi:hypothetical protein